MAAKGRCPQEHMHMTVQKLSGHLVLMPSALLVSRYTRSSEQMPDDEEMRPGKGSSMVQALERRNINIKRFDEIPMADVEMVFPDKKIFLKPLLIIQLLIAIIGGIIATFAALLSVRLSYCRMHLAKPAPSGASFPPSRPCFPHAHALLQHFKLHLMMLIPHAFSCSRMPFYSGLLNFA